MTSCEFADKENRDVKVVSKDEVFDRFHIVRCKDTYSFDDN